MDDFVINIHVDRKTWPIMAKPALEWDGNGKSIKSTRKKKRVQRPRDDGFILLLQKELGRTTRVGTHSKGCTVVSGRDLGSPGKWASLACCQVI